MKQNEKTMDQMNGHLKVSIGDRMEWDKEHMKQKFNEEVNSGPTTHWKDYFSKSMDWVKDNPGKAGLIALAGAALLGRKRTGAALRWSVSSGLVATLLGQLLQSDEKTLH